MRFRGYVERQHKTPVLIKLFGNRELLHFADVLSVYGRFHPTTVNAQQALPMNSGEAPHPLRLGISLLEQSRLPALGCRGYGGTLRVLHRLGARHWELYR